MKLCQVFLFVSLLLYSCGAEKARRDTFTIDTINKTTPVKDQGDSRLCWVYAMLATIESDRLMQGDSVNLSAAYVARAVLMEQAERMYLTQGRDSVTLSGMAPMLVNVIMRAGLMPYDSYRSDCNFNVVERRVSALANNAVAARSGLQRMLASAGDMLDEAVNPLPKHVYMFGAEYTPQEFARSVCRDDEYISLTSFTHKPFFENIILDLPDNIERCTFLNVPLDTLMERIGQALRSGCSVCWEGSINGKGFSFRNGTARLDDEDTAVTQEMRQRSFEAFRTADDHCMEIIGMSHDQEGRRYFICKNSWGRDNPYGGLMFMSVGYARLNTVAVVMKRDVEGFRAIRQGCVGPHGK